MSICYDRMMELCEKNGITLYNLESQLGFSHGTLRRWREDRSPNVDSMCKVADYFGVSIDWLCGRSEFQHRLETLAKETADIDAVSKAFSSPALVSITRGLHKVDEEERKRTLRMLSFWYHEQFKEEIGDAGDDADAKQ